MFRKHSPKQHAFFLSSMAVSNPINFNLDDVNPQASYDRLYDSLLQLLDKYYPEQRVSITSADPPFITPAVKEMLRRKNRLIRSGKVEQATALAGKIDIAIKNYNRAELSRVNILVDPRSMWTKVRQLTGRTKSICNQVTNHGISADILNNHYAITITIPISSDS